jgi:hypothetical protein
MSKSRATRIANDPDSSSKGAKASGGGKKRNTKGQGGTVDDPYPGRAG